MACAGILALELLSAALHEPLNSPHSPERFIRLKSARTTQRLPTPDICLHLICLPDTMATLTTRKQNCVRQVKRPRQAVCLIRH